MATWCHMVFLEHGVTGCGECSLLFPFNLHLCFHAPDMVWGLRLLPACRGKWFWSWKASKQMSVDWVMGVCFRAAGCDLTGTSCSLCANDQAHPPGLYRVTHSLVCGTSTALGRFWHDWLSLYRQEDCFEGEPPLRKSETCFRSKPRKKNCIRNISRYTGSKCPKVQPLHF